VSVAPNGLYAVGTQPQVDFAEFQIKKFKKKTQK
jgi:hypothetical protein